MDVSKFQDASLQCPRDIYQRGADERMCILGKFKMVWRDDPGKIKCLVIVTSSDFKKSSFWVLFELGEENINLLNFSPHDDFRLSLRGAVVLKLQNIPKFSNLPLQLIFSDGVHIQWTPQGPNEMREINTWLLRNAVGQTETTDSWFSKDYDVSRKRSLDRVGEVSLRGNPKETKRRRRAEKLAKQKAAAPENSNHLSDANSPRHSPSEIRRDISSFALGVKSTDLMDLTHDASQAPDNDKSMATQSNRICTSLADIQAGGLVTIIGVVTSLYDPRMSTTGDWTRLISIVDPTNYTGHDSGFKINCYTKRHKEWLPHPEEGEVLILRNVKIKEYQGSLTGVGYADKLQWAAFSPNKGEIHHGPPNDAPEDEGLAEGGFGASFSPFLHPGPLQTMHCVKISDWWRNLFKQAHTLESNVVTYRREHRLLSEASPSAPPNGYFDCTVEVVKGIINTNNDQVYSLYVTDYTRNEEMMGIQAKWCSVSLSDFVVNFEMWDRAAKIAATMQPGQYYSIKNARMVVNSRGFTQGKVCETKILRLTEEDTSSYLQALLQRKRLWQTKHRSPEADIKHLMIRDAREKEFFHCTVELLSVVINPKRKPCIYVTDYSPHPRLADANLLEFPSLKGQIVKITLSDEQEQFVKTLSIGNYYCIRKVRFKHSTVDQCFCCVLGGDEKLIIQLNPNNIANENLNGLLRRKEAWQRSVRHVQSTRRTNIPAATSILPVHGEKNGNKFVPTTIVDDFSLTQPSPEQNTIQARPIDFYPLSLEDAYYQQCRRCKIEIPRNTKACFKCNDFEHKHVQFFYQLYILLKDRRANEIIVSIDDKCALFDGLKRSCIQEDKEAFAQFLQRVEPLIGPLTKVHDALKEGKRVNVETCEYCFDVESWPLSDTRTAFRLMKYTLV